MSDMAGLSEAKRAILARMLAGDANSRTNDPIKSRDPAAVVPLSAGQRQVWIHEAVTGDPLLYTESVTFHRHGQCDVGALRSSVRDLVERHEALRAYLVFDGPEPGQAFGHFPDGDIPFDDLATLPADARDAAAIALATADARRPFDLERGPLFRARIVCLASDDHRLYLTLHHITFDGVTMYALILPDLAALYDARVGGTAPPPAPARIGYGDYAVWQRQQGGTAASRRAIDYWRSALADLPEKIDLAGTLNLPAHPTRAGAMETFAFSAALSDRIRSLGKANDATPYMVMLSGFAALLHRYTGAQDIIIGGVADLRRRSELAKVAGYFLNTVPLRSRPRPDLSFVDFLGSVRRTLLDTLDASEVPFDEVVRALDLRQSADVHPLFDILFSVEPPAPDLPSGWDLTQMDVEVGRAKFDLYLELDERPEGYVGRFLYSSEKFDRTTIKRFIRHWLMLLEQVTIDSALRLDEVSLVSLTEQSAVAAAIEAASVKDVRLLTERFADVVEHQPDEVAIRFEERSISYGELNVMADGVAACLGKQGFGPGSLVGVMLDRTPEMVAALIGILRSGAAYLPLDPAHPPARLAWIAADAKVDVLIIDTSVASSLIPSGLPAMVLNDCPPADRRTERIAIKPTDLAYILYTSGSTGTPKGVEIEHGALANLLGSMQARPGFRPSNTLLAITTISFDIAGLELFLPLASGGALLLAPARVTRDMAALRDLVIASAPTMMQATPATWRALVEEGLPPMPGMTILCGGEALAPVLAAALRQRCARLWNLYGPTETTIWSTIYEVVADEPTVPIGAAIDRTSVHVLGADGWPVTPGMAGELFIGGAGLARGYRHRLDLTADRFVERPFAPGLRLYRTGDVVRARTDRTDRTLEYVGRADGEEKIRGYRIAVEEIEQALRTIPTVTNAAIRSWPDASGERMLVAYIVTDQGEPLDTPSLRLQLAEVLPGYMIPSRFEWLAALPLTPNLKIDRKALPAPTDDTAARIVPALSDREARLAALWKDVLAVASVARDDSFFDLGGTSLMIAALLRRIEVEFDCRMTMASIFRAHCLGDMALAIGADHSANGLIPIQPHGSRPTLLWIDGGPKFRALATALGPDQPFLGVPLDEVLKDIDSRSVSFEECADRMAQLIRALYPSGPYLLGGWCTSGILAHAVAVSLRASGSSVPLVILADAENPSKRRSLHVQLTKTGYHVGRLVRQVGGDRLKYLRKRVHGVVNHFKAHPIFDHHGSDAIRDAMDIAALDYRPQRYDGPVALLCSHEWIGARDAFNGWLPLMSGPVVTREFPGDHDSLLLAPEVAELAASIRDALAGVDPGKPEHG